MLAVSERIRIDEHQFETRTASQTIELRGPLQLVFHDQTQKPAELARPGTLGVTFRTPPPPPQPPAPPAE